MDSMAPKRNLLGWTIPLLHNILAPLDMDFQHSLEGVPLHIRHFEVANIVAPHDQGPLEFAQISVLHHVLDISTGNAELNGLLNLQL